MNAKEFLKKYPKSQAREGNLENKGCPQCGNRDCLRIAFSGVAHVSDDTSEDDGDHEWEDTSACHCHCGNSGTVKDFTIPGLDDLIYEREPENPKLESV